MLFKGIVAVDKQWGFAKNKKIPWHYQEDLALFKKLTYDNVVVMGKNTYNEIAALRKYPEKNKNLFNDRISIVLSKSNDIFLNDSTFVINDFNDIFKIKKIKNKTIWLIGGKSIFDIGLSICGEFHITKINKDYNCDIFFDDKKLLSNFKIFSEENIQVSNNESLKHQIWVTNENSKSIDT